MKKTLCNAYFYQAWDFYSTLLYSLLPKTDFQNLTVTRGKDSRARHLRGFRKSVLVVQALVSVSINRRRFYSSLKTRTKRMFRSTLLLTFVLSQHNKWRWNPKSSIFHTFKSINKVRIAVCEWVWKWLKDPLSLWWTRLWLGWLRTLQVLKVLKSLYLESDVVFSSIL